METIAHRLPGTGVASAGVRLGAGWSNDPPEHRGLAHLLEHAQVLAGCRSGSLDEALLPLGTSLDGRTLAERTLLFIDCLRGDLAAVLPALLEAAFEPSFPPTQVASEREVVAASIPSREDYPPWQWARLLLDDALYGWDEFGALGSPGSVRSIPRDLLVEWHARHAVPSRCALCVAGDVTPEDVAALAAPWAVGGARTAASVPVQSPSPPHGGARADHRPGLRPELWLGFRIPPDVPAGAVELLRAVLSNQPGSLLWERLRQRSPLAYAVDAEVRAEPRGCRIGLYVGTAGRGALEACWDAVAELLRSLVENGVGAPLLDRARRICRLRLERIRLDPRRSMEWLLGEGTGRPGNGVLSTAVFDALASELDVVTGDALRMAARRVLSGSDPVASVVGDLGGWDPRRALDSLRATLGGR